MKEEEEEEEEGLAMWTVYDHPTDYPNQFVARKFLVNSKEIVRTNDMFFADTLEEIRDLLPLGLTNLHRRVGDDPNIIETWI
jgi:hypothetical protein